MNRLTSLLLLLGLSCHVTIASPPYEDRPAGITQAGAELLAHYEKLEMERFLYFEEQFINPVGRQFFLIARIDGNGIFEQVFVTYEKKQWGKYIGRIASQPTGRVSFKQGAKIKLKRKDIHGWTIVNQDGTEEGNSQGKALDLLHARKVILITELRPKNGAFAEFSVVSALNPQTKQKVLELVPPEALALADQEAKQHFLGKPTPDEKVKYSATIFSFPEWKIIRPDALKKNNNSESSS